MKIEVRNTGLRFLSPSRTETRELRDFAEDTAYMVDGARFSQAFRIGAWDGREVIVTEEKDGSWTAPVGLLGETFERFGRCDVLDERRPRGPRIEILLDPELELRGYQVDAVDAVFEDRGVATGKGLLHLPTRSGKTVIASEIIAKDGGRALFLVNSDGLLRQTVAFMRARLESDPVPDGLPLIGQYGGGVNEIGWITVASVQSITHHFKKAVVKRLLASCDVVFFDECFVSGTLVHTPSGKVSIESVSVGDEVISWDEGDSVFRPEVVTRISRRTSGDLYTVIVEGEPFTVTGEHPWLTDSGWVVTRDLATGVKVVQLPKEFLDEDSRIGVPRVSNSRLLLGGEDASAGPQGESLLFGRVPDGDGLEGAFFSDGRNESPTCIRANEEEESDETSGGAREAFAHLEGDRSSSERPRRQRDGSHESASRDPRTGRPWMGCGIHDRSRQGGVGPGEAEGLPNRRGARREEDRDRTRRGVSSTPEFASERREEGCVPSLSRVDSPPIHEWGRVDSVERSSLGPVPVYNFEVSGTHTYLVGERGCVVHNCHHLEGRLWRQAMTRADAGTKVGLSATIPEIAFSSLRTATKGTIWLIGATGPILFGLTPSDLIRDGWLCQPKITFLTPPELPWDLEGSFPVVYRAGIVENEGRNKLIAETAKREVRKKGNRVLITVRQRDHVLRLERALEAAGLSVVVVTGSTPGAKREALTSLVKRRERDVLLGTVFGEAVDLPFLETVIIADAGASPVLALQRLRNLTPVDEHDRPRRERMTPADVVPVYDFADLDHKILKRHSLARLKAYREHEEFMIRWVP